METTLQAGRSIDTLNKAELRECLREQTEALKALQVPTVIDSAMDVMTDAAGVLAETVVYTVPTGREAVIHRYHLASPAATPIAPIAVGWIGFFRDTAAPTNFFDFLPPQGTLAVCPATFAYGSDAKVLRNGQRLVVAGAGLPASTQFSFSFQVRLHDRSRGQVF